MDQNKEKLLRVIRRIKKGSKPKKVSVPQLKVDGLDSCDFAQTEVLKSYSSNSEQVRSALRNIVE